MTAPDLSTDLAVSRATAAARRGDLDGAAQALVGVGGQEPTALDLLARIRAQQGRWREADECWARLQVVDPDHEGAAAGRRAVAAILAGNRRPRPVAPAVRLGAAGGAVAVALTAGTVIVFMSLSDSPVGRPAGSVATPAPQAAALDAERRRAAELQSRLERMEADRAAAAQALADRLDAIVRDITVPGVVVKRRPGSVEVYFRKGLFSRDAWLTADGADMLATVGRRLRGLDVDVTVVGHSVPIPGGRTSGGSGTALARARVATRELAAAADLPLTAFTLRSADQSQGPFSEPARKRTASLVLTPRDQGHPSPGAG